MTIYEKAELIIKDMAEGLRMPGAMCGLWGICE